MDHILSKIQDYHDLYLQDFIEDYLRHNYNKFSESPLYPELRLIADSINLYRKYLELPRINLKAEILEGIERRKV